MQQRFEQPDAVVASRITGRRRDLLRMTQAELAQRTGISVERLSDLESGHREITTAELRLIATALKTTPEAMMAPLAIGFVPVRQEGIPAA